MYMGRADPLCPEHDWTMCHLRPRENAASVSANQSFFMILGASVLNRRASSAASANSQSRNVLIFGSNLRAYDPEVFSILSERSIGTTRRPLMRSQAKGRARERDTLVSAILRISSGRER